MAAPELIDLPRLLKRRYVRLEVDGPVFELKPISALLYRELKATEAITDLADRVLARYALLATAIPSAPAALIESLDAAAIPILIDFIVDPVRAAEAYQVAVQEWHDPNVDGADAAPVAALPSSPTTSSDMSVGASRVPAARHSRRSSTPTTPSPSTSSRSSTSTSDSTDLSA